MQANNLKQVKVALLVSGLMLCLAVVPVWPYGFYMVLRIAVFGTCVYTAYVLRHDIQRSKHVVPLVVLALLFNPVMPVYLERSFWLWIDLGAAVYFQVLAKKIPSK